ncbi:glycosyltransferase family 4 protein [Actinocrinis puniceicyclus]|uniref:Glycosyltransferase family 4 protein n=1 Tax=Actinocrinis puniceicyclus TaxID=977794 RepID=A0A8J8BC37_9ACTN|nr:glycosyltransferase family 4 protein [Actinocrinis puniceicyclus]MBS2964717.1 glycosyltransferase family 4 protein [Actinocrinis puniceicyclus]
MNDRPVRVLYWFTQPTPYAVARFNAAAQRPELDFHAVFSQVREPDRSWDVDESAWKFPAGYLGRIKVPVKELRRLRPDVFILEYDRWNLALGAVIGFAAARRVAFRVLPNFDAWSRRTWWRELGKRVLFKAVDAAKVPGPHGAALATRYGLPRERVTVVTQSIDVTHYGRGRDMRAAERQRRREALGLSGCVFLYVGRVWAGKGLDELFAAYRQVRAVRDDINLLIVGDGVDYERYFGREAATAGVGFAGFVQPADLPQWYALCDVLVFPTHGDPNGLVVEEALAAGLPVIVSDAAGDIRARVPECVGRVFPVGDAGALARAMRDLAEPSLRAPMARRAPAWVAWKDDERYAEDLARFARSVTASPRRRTVHRAACAAVGRLLAR